MINQRQARYGRNLYQVRVHSPRLRDGQDDVVERYFCADSITVRDGVLMLSAEVKEVDHSDEGDHLESVEVQPAAIFAPGQWLSVIQVSWDDHEAVFSEEFWEKIRDGCPDEEEDEEASQN